MEQLKISELYQDLNQTLAKELLESKTYPWEVLPLISEFIVKLGSTLSEEEYEKRGENVWVAKSAKVAPTAFINGPAIIGKEAEVRHCAFIRGNALVGEHESEQIYGCNTLMNEEYKDMYYLPVRVAELQTSFSRKQYFWPISFDELKRNKNLSQAPGWQYYD